MKPLMIASVFEPRAHIGILYSHTSHTSSRHVETNCHRSELLIQGTEHSRAPYHHRRRRRHLTGS